MQRQHVNAISTCLALSLQHMAARWQRQQRKSSLPLLLPSTHWQHESKPPRMQIQVYNFASTSATPRKKHHTEQRTAISAMQAIKIEAHAVHAVHHGHQPTHAQQ